MIKKTFYTFLALGAMITIGIAASGFISADTATETATETIVETPAPFSGGGMNENIIASIIENTIVDWANFAGQNRELIFTLPYDDGWGSTKKRIMVAVAGSATMNTNNAILTCAEHINIITSINNEDAFRINGGKFNYGDIKIECSEDKQWILLAILAGILDKPKEFASLPNNYFNEIEINGWY